MIWFPVIATALAVLLILWFLATAKGEDIMAGPIIIFISAAVTVISWGSFGIYHLLKWLF